MDGNSPPGPPPAQSIALTVLIRTLNEADRIGATIRSALPLGGEIVIVDSGSKDATVEIAQSLGAKVFSNPWPGFGPQRHWGEDKCSHDLVFSLDADEILTEQLVAEIRAVLLRPLAPRLMIVRKAMIFPHHQKPPPLGFCHEQILIYDRRIARTGPNPNWDKLDITADDAPHTLRNPIWHYSFRNWDHATAKWNYTTQLAADTQPKRSRLALMLRLIFEFPAAFLKFYFLRRYCLGGVDGFTMAMITAFGRFLRIAKMLENLDHPPSPRQAG